MFPTQKLPSHRHSKSHFIQEETKAEKLGSHLVTQLDCHRGNMNPNRRTFDPNHTHWVRHSGKKSHTTYGTLSKQMISAGKISEVNKNESLQENKAAMIKEEKGSKDL